MYLVKDQVNQFKLNPLTVICPLRNLLMLRAKQQKRQIPLQKLKKIFTILA